MTVLALESDPAQAATIRHVVCDLVRAELTLVKSVGDALQVLHTQSPDLILLPMFVAPAEEAVLVTFLRALPTGTHIETQITPVLGLQPATVTRHGWRRWRAHPTPLDSISAAERLFAERVSWSLEQRWEQQQAARCRAPNGPSAVDPPDHAMVTPGVAEPVTAGVADPLTDRADPSLLSADESPAPGVGYVEAATAGTLAPPIDEDTGRTRRVANGRWPPMNVELMSSESTARPPEVLETDRRAHPRLSAHELRWLRTARLKNGPAVTLIDLSISGMLIESDDRLCPGSTLSLELIGSSRIVAPFRIIRSQIARLREGALYRGACAFSRPLELPDLLYESSTTTDTRPLSPSRSAETPGPGGGQPSGAWSKVILRCLDGRPLMGFCNDFSASRMECHLWPSVGALSSQQMVVPLSRLKAVLFVRDFDANPGYVERRTFETAPHGRKLEVTFLDDEVIVGSTLSYRPDGLGFFLCPADPRSNNMRIFVVCGSIRRARFI